VDPSKKVPDLKCEVPDLLLEVVDLKQEVPDLRSGGITLNLTHGCQLELHQKLSTDAGQSPMLARPAAPLATGVTNISSVN